MICQQGACLHDLSYLSDQRHYHVVVRRLGQDLEAHFGEDAQNGQLALLVQVNQATALPVDHGGDRQDVVDKRVEFFTVQVLFQHELVVVFPKHIVQRRRDVLFQQVIVFQAMTLHVAR